MRISDWSSDVCSSDLCLLEPHNGLRCWRCAVHADVAIGIEAKPLNAACRPCDRIGGRRPHASLNRKSVVSGKSVSLRFDLGVRLFFTKKNIEYLYHHLFFFYILFFFFFFLPLY